MFEFLRNFMGLSGKAAKSSRKPSMMPGAAKSSTEVAEGAPLKKFGQKPKTVIASTRANKSKKRSKH